MTSLPAPPSFAQRLDIEWDRLRTGRRSLRNARAWCADTPEHPLARLVTGVESLDDIIAATQRGVGEPGEDDAILLRLVELARHDDLAGRLIIQRLVPGLTVRSVSYRSFHQYTDLLDLAVPAAWLAIRCYDFEHRRHHVAASLISDAVFQAFRRPLRKRSATEVASPERTFVARSVGEPAITALVELAEVIAEAQRAGVSTHDIDLIRHLVRSGSPSIVAAQRNVTTRTIRNHRDRAIAHIREAIGVAA